MSKEYFKNFAATQMPCCTVTGIYTIIITSTHPIKQKEYFLIMIALQITSMKNFMNQLLASDTFDIFLMEEAVISTSNTVTIDGHMNKDFFLAQGDESKADCPYDLALWSEKRSLCFNLIKGKRTPLFFKFVLHLKPEQLEKLLLKDDCGVEPSLVSAMVLTIKYDGQKATLTTGIAYNSFVMTKEPDKLWDRTITKYLAGRGISFEEL